MPVGNEKFLTVSAQSAAGNYQTEQESRQVEGGRESWGEQSSVDRGRRRSKRKINVNRLPQQNCHLTAQQQVSYDMSGVAPANQHQYQEEHSPSKRQHLDEYSAQLPPEEQNHGYEELNTSTTTDVATLVEHHDGVNLPVQGYNEEDTHLSGVLRGEDEREEDFDDEDLMSLMRRLQAEVTELLAKCGEALSEGIEYEAYFPVRIDRMLRATHDLEQSLLSQKQAMKDRLHEIASLL